MYRFMHSSEPCDHRGSEPFRSDTRGVKTCASVAQIRGRLRFYTFFTSVQTRAVLHSPCHPAFRDAGGRSETPAIYRLGGCGRNITHTNDGRRIPGTRARARDHATRPGAAPTASARTAYRAGRLSGQTRHATRPRSHSSLSSSCTRCRMACLDVSCTSPARKNSSRIM